MKVGELREKLSKLKKEELIRIASEFYKLIPKAKKEDYDLDAFIDNPGKKQNKSASKDGEKLEAIEIDLNKFIANAKAQFYLYPNRNVSKKERSTWRFKVKKWFKELSNRKRTDKNLSKQSKLLIGLYELMCESCGYKYFTAHDSFDSIGIEQYVFYRTVIDLLQEADGKIDSVRQCIKLILDNDLSYNSLHSELMVELINTFTTVDLKNIGIKIIEELIETNGFKPIEHNAKGFRPYKSGEYRIKEKNNNLAEFGMRLYFSLYEPDEGVTFYQKYYFDNKKEVKLYVLISILFELGEKDHILNEIEKAIARGIQPRQNLLTLMNIIKEDNELPDYL